MPGRGFRRARGRSSCLRQLLPAWLASFRAAGQPGSPAPEIVLTAANTETVISHVTKGQADIGFIEGPRQPRSVRGKVIGHDRLTVVVAPGHRWTRRRGGVSAAELAATALVSQEGGSGTRTGPAPGPARDLGRHR